MNTTTDKSCHQVICPKSANILETTDLETHVPIQFYFWMTLIFSDSLLDKQFDMSQCTDTVADLGGGAGGAPPGHPNSFNFMQFSGNFGKIVCWCPPPWGNPGSAAEICQKFFI